MHAAQAAVRRRYPDESRLTFGFEATPVSPCAVHSSHCTSSQRHHPAPALMGRFTTCAVSITATTTITTCPDAIAPPPVHPPSQTPTSKFEVTINDKLVHTKVGDGGLMPAGFPDSDTKLAPIFAAIDAALGASS